MLGEDKDKCSKKFKRGKEEPDSSIGAYLQNYINTIFDHTPIMLPCHHTAVSAVSLIAFSFRIGFLVIRNIDYVLRIIMNDLDLNLSNIINTTTFHKYSIILVVTRSFIAISNRPDSSVLQTNISTALQLYSSTAQQLTS